MVRPNSVIPLVQYLNECFRGFQHATTQNANDMWIVLAIVSFLVNKKKGERGCDSKWKLVQSNAIQYYIGTKGGYRELSLTGLGLKPVSSSRISPPILKYAHVVER